MGIMRGIDNYGGTRQGKIMTEETVRAFVERLTTDEEFAKKVADAPSKEERLRIINEAGYALTASDLSALKAALNVEELSDEDLEKVAGGAGVSGELSGILRSALTQGLP